MPPVSPRTGTASTVYVGTDMGLFQGRCRRRPSPNACRWYRYTHARHGFPDIAVAHDLDFDANSGILRVATLGRSEWEARIRPIPNPQATVNTGIPITGVLRSPRASASAEGSRFALAWPDDRDGQGASHIYWRAYAYDTANRPSALGADLRVDDAGSQIAQAPAIAAGPIASQQPYCAWTAWQDDRISPSTSVNVYYQQVCADGQRRFVSDQRADQSAPGIHAAAPAIVAQPSCSSAGDCDFTIAWQAEHSPGSGGRHDIYARRFHRDGSPNGAAFGTFTVPFPQNTYLDAANVSARTTPSSALSSRATAASAGRQPPRVHPWRRKAGSGPPVPRWRRTPRGALQWRGKGT